MHLKKTLIGLPMSLMMMELIGKIIQDGDVMKSHAKIGEMVMNILWLVRVITAQIVKTLLKDHTISVTIGIVHSTTKTLLN